jgi:hypothetical protein
MRNSFPVAAVRNPPGSRSGLRCDQGTRPNDVERIVAGREVGVEADIEQVGGSAQGFDMRAAGVAAHRGADVPS